MALSFCNAQKCAVLEFSGSKSISVSDVDGISEMFMTYFHPSGYTLVERAQIDRVISEQGFQRSSITDSQMVRIGKILNVSKVVVGKVSMLGGQYQVDVRVVDVETGNNVAFEGASFSGNYRTNVQNLAQKLAGQIAIRPQASVQQTIPNGYVDLGLPSGTLWKQNNEKKYLTINEAMNIYGSSLPSKAQFQELLTFCSKKWTNQGLILTGKNGKSISFPAMGMILQNEDLADEVQAIGSRGYYWTSSFIDGSGFFFAFDAKNTILDEMSGGHKMSIRLVK